ncbi:MAG: 50S ribosomal protein L4, partial [Planctomycetota bacterium]
SKMQTGRVIIVDELNFDAPKTGEFSRVLGNLKIDRSCLVTLPESDVNVYKSARNIKKVDIMKVSDLNAGDICNKQNVLFTKDAFLALLDKKKN